jgi:hypothetical protein
MNTTYDEIIDLALITIEDYKLNMLANKVVDETNYDLIISSPTYEDYQNSCLQNNPVIDPITKPEFNKIREAEYDSYEDYVSESMNTFKTIMDGFMVRGLPNFDNCLKDLSDRNDELRQFNFILTDREKEIIADYTDIMWLDKEINDTRQITAMLQNKNEAHRYSEANNLNAKRERRIQMNEDVSYKKTSYGLRNNNWKEWANNNYGL